MKLGATTVARSQPTASITETTSRAQNSGPITSTEGTREDRPMPRWSSRITRAKAASRRWKRYIDGSASTESIGIDGPGSSTRSIGPSPSTW